MSIHSVNVHELLLSAPLELPLRLRLAQGRFGAKRSNTPSGRAHDSVDLHAPIGSNVYPVISGRVVDARDEDDGRERGNGIITVFHHLPGGPGYLSRYNHLQRIDVSVGEFVEIGDQLGTVGVPESVDWEPHLHLTLRHVVSNDLGGLSTDALRRELRRDSRSMPVDPTRALYRWELEEYDNNPDTDLHFTPRRKTRQISEIIRQHIRYFRVRLDDLDGDFLVPHYQPSADETSMVETLRQAHMHAREVVIGWRDSPFWENKQLIAQTSVF